MSQSSRPDLKKLFNEINSKHFNGKLVPPHLHWNSRLRTSAGRFTPCARKFWKKPEKPTIDIALYLIDEEKSLELIRDTMGHEMIHYWLWSRRKPYGHTAEFHAKRKLMGVSRYNTVPKLRPYKHLYQCPACQKDYPARRKWKGLACAKCCKTFASGVYDSRFKLKYVGPMTETDPTDARDVSSAV